MPATSHPIRILLVDDHVLVRQGVRMLLENAGDLEVIGEAANCAEAISAAGTVGADVVVLDLDLGAESGLDAIAALNRVEPKLRVLVLTGTHNSELHRSAIRLGAAGIVLKESAGELLVKAIRRVHEGEIWVDRAMATTIFEEYRNMESAARRVDPEAARIGQLTAREREIIALVAQGMNTPQLATRLSVAEKTVRNHLASIYDKLGVHDRLTLALYVARHGLAGSDPGSRP